ncbi:MAG: hypothetical protein WCH83_13655 [Alphaproteobacteria bacterium]
MRSSIVLALAVTLGLALPAAAQTPRPFEPRQETPDVLPAGEGRDETFYLCTACHSSGLLTRTGQTREGWDDLINQMVAKHKMNEPDAAERRVLLDYLATAFPPRTTPGGWRNPFAPQ